MVKHREPRVKKDKWLVHKPTFDQIALASGKQIEVTKDNQTVEGLILKSTSNKLTVAYKWEVMEISVDEVVSDVVKLDVVK